MELRLKSFTCQRSSKIIRFVENNLTWFNDPDCVGNFGVTIGGRGLRDLRVFVGNRLVPSSEMTMYSFLFDRSLCLIDIKTTIFATGYAAQFKMSRECVEVVVSNEHLKLNNDVLTQILFELCKGRSHGYWIQYKMCELNECYCDECVSIHHMIDEMKSAYKFSLI